MRSPIARYGLGLVLGGVVLAYACSTPPPAPPPGPKAFDSAAAAGAALFDAASKNDESAMLAVLGPDAKDLVSSGDAAEDAEGRQTFADHYRQMHRIGLDGENRTALIVGSENWPVPIPLVEHDGKWTFDVEAGKQEVLYRRIGRNEMSAMRICQELVAAEKQYFAAAHDGEAAHQYAQHFVSSSGKHDGLFWEAGNGESESPVGPLLAFAASETEAKTAQAGRTPFQGYYFRLLRAQGEHGPGGAHSYLVDGKMTRGFAFLAYPAEYRSSGVMTFLVGPDGVVLQKDLGANADAPLGITTFDPDGSWVRAE